MSPGPGWRRRERLARETGRADAASTTAPRPAADTEEDAAVVGSSPMIKLLLSRRIGNLAGFFVCAGIYGGAIALIAAVGVAVAGRHVWLQHTPADQRPACGPALDHLLSAFGPIEGLRRVLRGSGECGVVDWTLLSFSIPEWTLAAFLVFAAWAAWLARRRSEEHTS